jgi:hypothetical protein
LTTALREVLDANDGEIIKVLVQTAIDRAKAGDFRYFKEIMDRVDGKVTNRMDVSDDGQSYLDLPGLTAEELDVLAEMRGGPTD